MARLGTKATLGVARRLLQVPGGKRPIVYLLRVEFATDDAAPLTSPYVGEVGQVTPTQNDGELSAASGLMAFPAQTTPTYGDQGIIGSALTRVAGRTLIDSFNMTTVDEVCILGWMNTNTLNYSNSASISHIVRFFTTALVTQDKSASAIAQAGAPSTATNYKLALVLRSTGCFALIKGGSYTDWTLFWIFADNSATVYPVFSNYAAAGTLDYIRVTDLAAPFDTDYGIATVRQTSFTQTLGSDLTTNGSLAAWTGDNPDNWTVTGESGSDPEVSQVDSGQLHGGTNVTGGSANFYSTSAALSITQAGILSIGSWYEAEINISAYSSGIADLPSPYVSGSATVTGVLRVPHWSAVTDFATRLRAAGNFTIDSISIKAMTLNAKQTGVADGIYDFAFTLPASPRPGERVMLQYRIVDENNFWMCYLKRNSNNTDWDFLLESWSSGTATNRINATSIGSSPTAIRVITSGNSHDCYSLSGTTWTKRGATVTNSTHATAVDVRAIYASTVTPGSLTVYPRTSANYAALEAI